MHSQQPLYLQLHHSGELADRAAAAQRMLQTCTLCGHDCQVNRQAGERGRCATLDQARVYGAHPHFGEETCLVGWRGSGTIFFSHCNLQCQFCQNYELSQQGEGRDVTAEELARMMLHLQDEGCHNLNLVSPTHVLPMILQALTIAADHGLRLPLVYNTGGYDSLACIELLDGIVDIYMPDMKFADAELAERLCGAADYPVVNRAVVTEMYRQVGDLQVNEQGVARRGLLVRHLLLPGGTSDLQAIARFLAAEVSPAVTLNLMAQYSPPPCGKLHGSLQRPLLDEEYEQALAAVEAAGLQHVIAAEQAPAWR